jgi:ubiquinone biosynthesis protein UbiJ
VAPRVENVLMSALQELANVFGADRVINAAGQVLQTAAQTKAAVDDNVASMLALAGLPSKGDLDSLRRQLDVVQATLANLSRKLDRLAEEVAQQDHPSHLPGRRRPSRIRPGED